MSQKIPPELEVRLRQALRSGDKDEARRVFREATGASETLARFAVLLMSISKIAHTTPDPPGVDSTGPDERGHVPDAAPTPAAPPPTADRPIGDGGRSAVKASSGCGSMVLVALGPLLAAAGWLMI